MTTLKLIFQFRMYFAMSVVNFDLTEEYDEDNDPYENPDDFQDQEDYP